VLVLASDEGRYITATASVLLVGGFGMRPFEIDVPASEWTDLRERLAHTRWPDDWEGVGWSAGADLRYVRELCAYWRDGFDWFAQQRRLNAMPGFRRRIDGVDIHFWHVRSGMPAAVPLLLLHGWPGSMYEFLHLIGPLTDPGAHGGDPVDAFDVVVPSLPGFGFGGKPASGGWGPTRIAEALHTLMHDLLGYSRYAAQGGDWGSAVAQLIAGRHPDDVLGIHLNFVLSALQLPADRLASPRTEREREIVHRRRTFADHGSAYAVAQGTVPRSLTLAQADSPAGLAAWIVDKFRSWSDCDGDVERAFTKDQLLTNLMFYWAPNSVASAARLYYEARRDTDYLSPARVEVPTAVVMFPFEIMPALREWVEPWYDLRRWTEMPRGGHFAALEVPDLWLDDVRAFFRTLR
jgi:pimeloyl-ACP methyl ester carboxylesterase